MTATVMATRFVDPDGNEHRLADLSDLQFCEWHTRGNRRHYGKPEPLCAHCGAHVYPVQLRNGLRFVRHEAGSSLEACEYVDFVRSSKPAMGHRHKEAAATIGLAIRGLKDWDATAEHRLIADDGKLVIPDVYAWHKQPSVDRHRPVIHEVQLSPQSADETQRRTEQRRHADDNAHTVWWSPDPDTIGTLNGAVVDPTCTRVVDRAFTGWDPPVPMRPTVAEAARGLVRDRQPWAFIDLTGDGTKLLVPFAILSSVRPPSKRIAKPERDEPGERFERGCKRDVRPGFTGATKYCIHPEGCRLTATQCSEYCWVHTTDMTATTRWRASA